MYVLIGVLVYYRSLMVYGDFLGFGKWTIQTLQWLQWRKAVFQPAILYCLFDSFGEKLTMLVNLATKPIVTAGVFLIDTWTPLMISYNMKLVEARCTMLST